MSAVADLLDSGKQVDPSVLSDLVEFLRVFADQCHHEKEEQHLFPLLATKGNVSTRRELQSLGITRVRIAPGLSNDGLWNQPIERSLARVFSHSPDS
jgi:hypothetical protein